MGPRGGCTCLVRNVVGPERLVVVRKRVQRISRHLVVPDALVRVAARHTRCRRVSVHMATAELGLRTLIVLVLGLRRTSYSCDIVLRHHLGGPSVLVVAISALDLEQGRRSLWTIILYHLVY